MARGSLCPTAGGVTRRRSAPLAKIDEDGGGAESSASTPTHEHAPPAPPQSARARNTLPRSAGSRALSVLTTIRSRRSGPAKPTLVTMRAGTEISARRRPSGAKRSSRPPPATASQRHPSASTAMPSGWPGGSMRCSRRWLTPTHRRGRALSRVSQQLRRAVRLVEGARAEGPEEAVGDERGRRTPPVPRTDETLARRGPHPQPTCPL